jgi:hypothetical protein
MIMTVPRRNKCLFPHTLADGTKNIPAAPTPIRKYPVRTAILLKGSVK